MRPLDAARGAWRAWSRPEPDRRDLDLLLARALVAGWLAVSAAVALLVWLSYLAVPGPRLVLGLVLLWLLVRSCRGFARELARPEHRGELRRLPRHVRVWLFGPLLVAAVLTLVGVTVTPTDSARYVALVYAVLASVALRVGGLAALAAIAIRAVNGMPRRERRGPKGSAGNP